MTMIDELPDVCLEHIFSFLQIPDRLNIEKVCKRWYDISKRGWKSIRRAAIPGEYDDYTTHMILKRCGRHIKELNLTIDEKSLNWIPMAIKLCRLDEIEKIEVHLSEDCAPKTKSIVDALKKFFSMTRNVKSVKIEFPPDFAYFDYLNVMPPEKLQSLIIEREDEDDESCDDESGIDVFRFPNLEVLDCECTTILEPKERSYDGVVFKFKEIRLSYCSICRSLSEKFKFFTELEELSLFHNQCYMDNEDIRVIAANCPKLKKLGLGELENVSSLCFRDIGRMPSLERLDVGLLNIRNALDIKHLTNVEHLNFKSCESLKNHKGLVQCILNSPKLQSLTLDQVDSLKEKFLMDVWRIYETGRRTVPLLIEMGVEVHSIDGRLCKWWIPQHPLLTIGMHYYDADW